jgi:hypothetical protein
MVDDFGQKENHYKGTKDIKISLCVLCGGKTFTMTNDSMLQHQIGVHFNHSCEKSLSFMGGMNRLLCYTLD